jgi:hypothetical protein
MAVPSASARTRPLRHLEELQRVGQRVGRSNSPAPTRRSAILESCSVWGAGAIRRLLHVPRSRSAGERKGLGSPRFFSTRRDRGGLLRPERPERRSSSTFTRRSAILESCGALDFRHFLDRLPPKGVRVLPAQRASTPRGGDSCDIVLTRHDARFTARSGADLQQPWAEMVKLERLLDFAMLRVPCASGLRRRFRSCRARSAGAGRGARGGAGRGSGSGSGSSRMLRSAVLTRPVGDPGPHLPASHYRA